MNELGVLLFLSNNPSAKTASDISRSKRATKAHVSLAVKELTKKGYRTQHPEKGRNIRLEVTPRAEPLVAVGRQKQRDFLKDVYKRQLLFHGIPENRPQAADTGNRSARHTGENKA